MFIDLVAVSTDMENKAAWKECFSVRGIRLPTGYYFGITAATGDLTDAHDVLSVRLFELDTPNDVSKFKYIFLINLYTRNFMILSFPAKG